MQSGTVTVVHGRAYDILGLTFHSSSGKIGATIPVQDVEELHADRHQHRDDDAHELRYRTLGGRGRTVVRIGKSHHAMTMDIAVRNFCLDTQWYELSFGAERVRLTPLETRLLCALLKEPGRPLPRTTIAEALWGSDVYVPARPSSTCTFHNLRAKLRLLAPAESGLIERRADAFRFNPGNLQNAKIVVR